MLWYCRAKFESPKAYADYAAHPDRKPSLFCPRDHQLMIGDRHCVSLYPFLSSNEAETPSSLSVLKAVVPNCVGKASILFGIYVAC